MKHLEQTLKALANERRLMILRELKRKKSGMPVGHIAERIKLSFRTTSKHVRQLAAAGLLATRRRGRYTIYRLSLAVPPAARSVIAVL